MSGRRLYPAVRTLLPSLLLSLLVVALAPPARAQAPRRVGIVITTAVNVSPGEADALATVLADALHQELPVDVIAGAEARRRLPPGGLPEGCVASAECREDLGQRLDVAELLLLVMVRMGDRVQIDPTWTNIASGQVIARDAVVLAADATPAAVFTSAAPRLLPHLARAPAPQTPEQPRIVVVPAGRDAGSARHMTTRGWIAAGVGTAALVGATVFALSAQSKFQTLDDAGCRTGPCSPGDVDTLERHALTADVLFATSMVAGVATLVLYLRSAGEAAPAGAREASPPAVTMGAGPGGLSVFVGGAF